MATLLKGCLPSFIDILGYVSFTEMIKTGFLLSFEDLNTPTDLSSKPNRTIPEVKSKMISPPPIVRSVMVHKICQALGIDTELNPAAEFKNFKLPQKRKPNPIVHSVAVFKLCEALNIKASLANPLPDLN
ncbi:hypothetical protein TNCT_597801 [Trichonephila clavata]|uniref:Uncharacterized protein n=1 Tax=Trichonephila clavata TaxID=2740835 RepID=A0A8X6M6Q7_TRICU|nr:hypothetical protein TNCT_597801 [Trichonephila clavata]